MMPIPNEFAELRGKLRAAKSDKPIPATYTELYEITRLARLGLAVEDEGLLALARTIAEWHEEDGDECGTIARDLISRLAKLGLEAERKGTT